MIFMINIDNNINLIFRFILAARTIIKNYRLLKKLAVLKQLSFRDIQKIENNYEFSQTDTKEKQFISLYKEKMKLIQARKLKEAEMLKSAKLVNNGQNGKLSQKNEKEKKKKRKKSKTSVKD